MVKRFKEDCHFKVSIWNKWVKLFTEYDLYGKHSVYPHWEYRIDEFTKEQIVKAKNAQFGEEIVEILNVWI